MTDAHLKRARDAERMVWISSRLAATRADDVRLQSILVAVHESLRRRSAGGGQRAAVVGLVVEPFEEISDYAAFVDQYTRHGV